MSTGYDPHCEAGRPHIKWIVLSLVVMLTFTILLKGYPTEENDSSITPQIQRGATYSKPIQFVLQSGESQEINTIDNAFINFSAFTNAEIVDVLVDHVGRHGEVLESTELKNDAQPKPNSERVDYKLVKKLRFTNRTSIPTTIVCTVHTDPPW